jgi:hypothetical protein
MAYIEGEKINVCQGVLSDSGNWYPDDSFNTSNNMDKGAVIEKPVSGTYIFELVRNNGTYTLSHFPV